MEKYSAEIKKLDGQRITLDLQEALNIERLQTFYFDYEGERMAEVKILDPRQFTPQQRTFAFALMNDIFRHFGEPTESQQMYFYSKYEGLTGEKISLKDISTNSVDDVNLLIDIIIDFVLENNVPLKEGHEILPANMEYYLFKCCSTRTCCVCGTHPCEIDHFNEVVGMGRDRRHIDHSQMTFCALCSKHHQEKHKIGPQAFSKKYHVKGIKLNEETIKRLRIGG